MKFSAALVNSDSSNSTESRPENIGAAGERLAAAFLAAHGYRLILSNFIIPVGRNSRGVQVTGEIDIVALDEDGVLCFVEVKTRSSDAFAGPLSAVDLRKQRQITRTAKTYKRVFGLSGSAARFDVVTVIKPPVGRAKIEIIRGFWNENKFRKRRWDISAAGEYY